jgi:hypothetical protein
MLTEEQETDLSDNMIIEKLMNMNSILPGPTDGVTEKRINYNSKSRHINKSPKGVDPFERHMKFIYCIFKNYCKIGVISFGFIFMANLIESFDMNKFINFFKLFLVNFVRSSIFGLIWPISIFKLTTNKKIEF